MKVIIIPILVLLLIQTFSKWVIVLDYKINKEFIAQNLCENRSKPKSECKGKCQLSKKLAQEENGSNSRSTTFKWGAEDLLFINNFTFLESTIEEKTLGKEAYYLCRDYSVTLASLFRPPSI